MSRSDFNMENPLGLPILPHLRRQISSRIGDYSAKVLFLKAHYNKGIFPALAHYLSHLVI